MRRSITLASTAVALATAVAVTVPAGQSIAAAGHASTTLPAINVAMNGKTITVSGALQSGGVQVVSTVPAKHQSEPMFIRLDPGVTYAQFWALFHSKLVADPNNMEGTASIVFDAEAGGGTSSEQTSLQPGLYVGFDSEGNNPAKWPWTQFAVSQAASPATLPHPGATVAAIEFGFTGPARLHRGELVQFANHGFLIHMVIGIRAKNLAGARKIVQLLKAGKDNQASKLANDFVSFMDPASHGAFLQTTISAPAGYWVLACFMDTQDGREHTQLGMERIIQIVK